MKVIISSYICEPNLSSEATIGWEWVSHLCKYHEIVVIARKPILTNKINEFIKGNPSIRFEYYELPKIFNFMKSGNIRHFIYYNLWQLGAFFYTKKLVKKERFDIVHHLVYVNSWQPTYMAFLGIPFIFGPIGENPNIPFKIIKYYGLKAILKEYISRAIKNLSRYIIMNSIYKKAYKIIVINYDVYKKIKSIFWQKTIICPAVGFKAQGLSEKDKNALNIKRRKFSVLYVGRYQYIKAPDLALEGFLKFAENYEEVELIMIGGGKMQDKLRRKANASSQGSKVTILGWLNQKEVFEYIKKCDIFLLPTFEGGGLVILEAMAYGKPVICLDYGGPKELVTNKCGIKIPVSNRNNIIEQIAESIEILYLNSDMRADMGLEAKRIVNLKYTWDKKIEQIEKIYNDINKKK